MYKSIMFTHDDLDGAGCCVLFRLFNDPKTQGTEWNVICSSLDELEENIYNEISSGNVVSNYTVIYFADLCPRVPIAQDLISQGFQIMVFDHHITNRWICDLLPNAVVTESNDSGVRECGTSLFYKHAVQVALVEPGHEYFSTESNEKLLPEFVETVRLYDTYEWKRYNEISARHLQILFFMLGMEKFCDRYVEKLTNKNDQNLINSSDMDFIIARLTKEKKAIDKFDSSKVIDLTCRGRRVAFTIGSQGANFSDLSSVFLQKYPNYDAVVNFYISPGGGRFHIRGRGDINLAEELAEPIGGGGHPGACGAPVSPEYLDKFRAVLIEYLTQYHV